MYSWELFLTQWNDEMFNAANIDDYALPPDVLRSRWLGFPGATELQIARAEARLGIDSFPPSYRQFLAFTNGWLYTGTFIDRLWSTEEVDWLRVRNGNLIDIYDDFPDPGPSEQQYFDYDDNEAVTRIRTEHLKTVLEVSDVGDTALYLLNPNVKDKDGEWEAWFYASWLPGFRRYPSFWALMQAEYESFRQLEAEERLRYRPGKATGTVREKLPGLVQKLERVADEMAELSLYQKNMGVAGVTNGIYQEGFISALRDAAQRVQRLMSETPDDSALLEGLRQLINTLAREAQALQPTTNVADVFTIASDPARVKETLNNGGALAGKQQAAGLIQWVLNL